MMLAAIETIAKYCHTIRHLKAIQVYQRIWLKVTWPKPDLAPAPPVRQRPGEWANIEIGNPTLVGPDSFLFLGEAGSLESDGWNGSSKTKLWRYHQHYFNDLNSRNSLSRLDWHYALISDWLEKNEPGKGVGWEPYPTSLRIINWVKFAFSGHKLSPGTLHSLAVQCRWLAKRLEYHLLGNHLFSNAKALMFAGLYFGGPEGERFREVAGRILDRELSEQFLDDGGHFELSPMYHSLALEDLLDLCNLWSTYQSALNSREKSLWDECQVILPKMRYWLAAMSHPDGEISLFNDAAFGVAPTANTVETACKILGYSPVSEPDNLVYLQASGYARLANKHAVLILDLGRIGPDYLPGHAHADTLSLELSLFGSRLFVNSGTSTYDAGGERLRQRGTSAHNTVTVGGENSSEVWSSFRVARRANVFGANVWRQGESLFATGQHDGFRRVKPGCDHKRDVALSNNGLVITDKLSRKVGAEAYYHLNPDVSVQQTGAYTGTFTLFGGQQINWEARGKDITIESGTWHPEFGKTVQNNRLKVNLMDGEAKLILNWL